MKQSLSPSKKSSNVVSIRKRNSGGGLLATLRRMVQRKRPTDSTTAAASSPSEGTTASHTVPSYLRASASTTASNAPHHIAHEQRDVKDVDSGSDNNEWNDDNDDDDDDDDSGHESQRAGDGAEDISSTSKNARGKKRSTKRKVRWVRQLLNQDEKKRDRVHKKPVQVAAPTVAAAVHRGPPTLFVVASAANSTLVARILGFLDIRCPAAVCAYVSSVFSVHVRAFYSTHCAHPRPQRYLAQMLFNAVSVTTLDRIRETILTFMSVTERVRASVCCRSLYDSANALPLVICGSDFAMHFVECVSPERAEARFCATTELRLEHMDAYSAVQVVRLLDTNDFTCFPALSTLRLCSVRGWTAAPSNALFVQLIQVLFTDRMSRSLCVLELSDIGLEDVHYRDLARLFYDAKFPLLQHLSLSRNAFSSRFVRDWSRGFCNDRFEHIQVLAIRDVAMTDEDTQRFVACLADIPTLQKLCIANNAFSSKALALLSEQVAAGSLQNLTELDCSAITADASAMGSFFAAFQSPQASRQLRVLDVSGNSVANPRAASQLAQTLARQCWPMLERLNLSHIRIGEQGLDVLAVAMRSAPATAITHLDLTGNAIGRSVHSFSRCIVSGALPKLQLLSLADNNMEALEFESIAHALASGRCPLLQTLDLSMNSARGEGVTRFCAFLRSSAAHTLYSLDLSQNEIPSSGLALIAETLQQQSGWCRQLQQLNVAHNSALRSVVAFQDMIRSVACPSLVSLQVGYAQTFDDGRAFVQGVLTHLSVDELRRRKQTRFEQRLAALQQQNASKATRDFARCTQQCKLLRERFDMLESAADRALRRRKAMRKSPHLMIHQEIACLKHKQYDRELSRALATET